MRSQHEVQVKKYSHDMCALNERIHEAKKQLDSSRRQVSDIGDKVKIEIDELVVDSSGDEVPPVDDDSAGHQLIELADAFRAQQEALREAQQRQTLASQQLQEAQQRQNQVAAAAAVPPVLPAQTAPQQAMGQGSGVSIGDPDEDQDELTAFDELLLAAETQASDEIERHRQDIACANQEEEAAELQRQNENFRIHSSAGTAFRSSQAPKVRRVEPYECTSPAPRDHKGKQQDSHSPGFGRMDQ